MVLSGRSMLFKTLTYSGPYVAEVPEAGASSVSGSRDATENMGMTRILPVSITVGTLPPTAVSAASLIIAPNAAQDVRTLGVNFIALIGKYQNQIINSGITSTVVFVDGGYSLVRTPTDAGDSMLTCTTELYLAGRQSVHIATLPSFRRDTRAFEQLHCRLKHDTRLCDAHCRNIRERGPVCGRCQFLWWFYRTCLSLRASINVGRTSIHSKRRGGDLARIGNLHCPVEGSSHGRVRPPSRCDSVWGHGCCDKRPRQRDRCEPGFLWCCMACAFPWVGPFQANDVCLECR